MSVDLTRLIAALRDTAEKATATVTVQEPDFQYDLRRPTETIMRDVTHDKHSREWIAGRLLGMADTLEAMLGLADTMRSSPSHTEAGE